MTRQPGCVHDRADSMGYALLSFVIAALAAYLLWRFGEPVLIHKFGIAAPWWVYALLFIRPVIALARAVADEPSVPQRTRGRVMANRQSVPEDDQTAPRGATHST